MTITDTQLLDFFGQSPLSRRKIRRRLGNVPNRVMSAVLFSAIKRGIIRRVDPVEVGYGGAISHVYTPIKIVKNASRPNMASEHTVSKPTSSSSKSLYSRFFQ